MCIPSKRVFPAVVWGIEYFHIYRSNTLCCPLVLTTLSVLHIGLQVASVSGQQNGLNTLDSWVHMRVRLVGTGRHFRIINTVYNFRVVKTFKLGLKNSDFSWTTPNFALCFAWKTLHDPLLSLVVCQACNYFQAVKFDSVYLKLGACKSTRDIYFSLNFVLQFLSQSRSFPCLIIKGKFEHLISDVLNC